MKLFNVVKKYGKKFVGAISATMTMAVIMLSTFAAEDYVAIQATDLAPILEGAKANIGVIIPVAVGLFAIVLGVGFLPTIIKKFRH